MKKILLFTCVLTLLSTTGCIVADGGRHQHDAVVVAGPPVVVVHPPEVIVR